MLAFVGAHRSSAAGLPKLCYESPSQVDPGNSVRGRRGSYYVCYFSHQRIPNCFSRWSIPVFLTKSIATCAVPEGGYPDRGLCPSLDLRMSPCFAIFNLILYLW